MTQITTANACAQSTAAPMGAAAIKILRRLYGFPDSMTDDEVRRAVKARIDAYEEGEIDQQPAASAETIQDLLRQIRDELRGLRSDLRRRTESVRVVGGPGPEIEVSGPARRFA